MSDVKVRHVRVFDAPMQTVEPKGGVTFAVRKHASGELSDIAVAMCSPVQTFSKKRGCQIALDRLDHPRVSVWRYRGVARFSQEETTLHMCMRVFSSEFGLPYTVNGDLTKLFLKPGIAEEIAATGKMRHLGFRVGQ